MVLSQHGCSSMIEKAKDRRIKISGLQTEIFSFCSLDIEICCEAITATNFDLWQTRVALRLRNFLENSDALGSTPTAGPSVFYYNFEVQKFVTSRIS